MSDETWKLRDDELASRLEADWPKATLGHSRVNITRLYDVPQRAIIVVYLRKGRPPKTQADADPFVRFLMANLHRPETDHLLESLEQHDRGRPDRYMRHISSDGWWLYLKDTNKNDTRSLSGYLARFEGRKRRGFVPADSTSVRGAAGNLVLAPVTEVRPIASTFRSRSSAPAVINQALPRTDPNNTPRPPLRRPVAAAFRLVQRPDVQPAIANIPERRTREPDGFPAEIFKGLKSVQPYLASLLNAI